MSYYFENTNEETKKLVWAKGKIIPDYSPDLWRWDACGKPIRYTDHGNTESKYGWEIDHMYPRAYGGKTTLDNLQPLQWELNRAKSDKYPWSCPV